MYIVNYLLIVEDHPFYILYLWYLFILVKIIFQQLQLQYKYKNIL
mgnify:CR=1 FL=1